MQSHCEGSIEGCFLWLLLLFKNQGSWRLNIFIYLFYSKLILGIWANIYRWVLLIRNSSHSTGPKNKLDNALLNLLRSMLMTFKSKGPRSKYFVNSYCTLMFLPVIIKTLQTTGATGTFFLLNAWIELLMFCLHMHLQDTLSATNLDSRAFKRFVFTMVMTESSFVYFNCL